MRYYLLKAANLALTSAWSFALIFVLVRVLPLADYANVAVVTGLGGYVLAVNLGFSTVVYANLRRNFLEHGPAEERAISIATLVLYAGFAGLAALIFWACVFGLPIGSPGIRLALAVHFTALSCALPWTIVRVSAAAVDRFMAFELIELARRALALVLVIAMLFGLSFLGYAALSLLLWLAAFAATYPIMGGLWRGVRLDEGMRRLRNDIRAIRHTGVFSALETAIYNFPYMFVPFLYGASSAVVAFDTFYKIVRFGASAYLASAEATLPAQTRALHEGDRGRLAGRTAMALGLGALPMIVGILAVTVFGDFTFGHLLKKAGLIPETTRIAMGVMLAAMLIQTISGNLLVNTGKAALLARLSWVIAAGLALFSAAVMIFHLPFSTFILGYAAVYAAGAVAYGALLTWKMGLWPGAPKNLNAW